MSLNQFDEKNNCGCGGNLRDKVVEKEANATKCRQGESCGCTQSAQNMDVSVKILGTNGAQCDQLEKNTQEALKELGMNTQIEHVTDLTQIEAYGAVQPPALVINGEVAGYGKVLSKDEIVSNLRGVR